jgi:hypothetical protein
MSDGEPYFPETHHWIIPHVVRLSGVHLIIAPGAEVGTAARFATALRGAIAKAAPFANVSTVEPPSYDFGPSCVELVRQLERTIGWVFLLVLPENTNPAKVRLALEASDIAVFVAPDGVCFWVPKCDGGQRGKAGRLSMGQADVVS